MCVCWRMYIIARVALDVGYGDPRGGVLYTKPRVEISLMPHRRQKCTKMHAKSEKIPRNPFRENSLLLSMSFPCPISSMERDKLAVSQRTDLRWETASLQCGDSCVK